jgi:hypothetical protein
LIHPEERSAILVQRAEPLMRDQASVGAVPPDLLLALVQA